jgi:hypothetical protein
MNFDLNINNYQKSELVDIFGLPPHYDKNILDIKETKLRENIMNNPEISKEIKIKTLEFLIQAKNILLDLNKNATKNREFQENIKDYYNSSYDLKPIKVDDQYGHMIQDKKELPYLSSFPSEIFPGVINPLKRRTNRLSLNIDTRFRDNYYGCAASNFNINLPLQMTNVVSMQLTSIELPLTFFNISKQLGCNFFTIRIKSGTSEETKQVVTLADGNYDQTGIVNLLNQQMTNLGGFYAGILFEINYTNNGGSGQMIVSLNSNYTGETFQFSLDFQADRSGSYDSSSPLPLKLGWILGFRNGVYENNSIYVSESIVDLNTIKYVYLVIDDYNNNVNNGFYSAFNSSILNKNILARISLPSPAFTVFSENNFNLVTYARQYFGPVTLQNMTIQLLDPYGRILDLNNIDYSFCLTLQTIYDI